eukprot:Lankesteria_metandrocarpae@DN2012_c0_g1_i3.p1
MEMDLLGKVTTSKLSGANPAQQLTLPGSHSLLQYTTTTTTELITGFDFITDNSVTSASVGARTDGRPAYTTPPLVEDLLDLQVRCAEGLPVQEVDQLLLQQTTGGDHIDEVHQHHDKTLIHTTAVSGAPYAAGRSSSSTGFDLLGLDEELLTGNDTIANKYQEHDRRGGPIHEGSVVNTKSVRKRSLRDHVHSGGERSGGERSGGERSGGERSGGERSGGERSGGER